jgi:hypothetical protein
MSPIIAKVLDQHAEEAAFLLRHFGFVHMNGNSTIDGIDWEGKGYFGRLETPDRPPTPAGHPEDLFVLWAEVFQ